MSGVLIDGFGDDLSVDGVRIGDLTPHDHEKIEKEKGGQNYSPLENVVISKVKDSSTLIARKPHPEDISKYIEEEVLDGLCCYSAVNQGQLNQTIVNAVIKHLQEEKLPTVPRSIRHKYMSAFLLAATSITGMDRVIPKVAGVESWELSFKICRRWGYEVKGIPANEAIMVGATGNFHGRSLSAVSFSDDPDAKENFGPFVPGIELVPYNDVEALQKLFEEKGEGDIPRHHIAVDTERCSVVVRARTGAAAASRDTGPAPDRRCGSRDAIAEHSAHRERLSRVSPREKPRLGKSTRNRDDPPVRQITEREDVSGAGTPSRRRASTLARSPARWKKPHKVPPELARAFKETRLSHGLEGL